MCLVYCHVPGHWLSTGPWQKSGPIWAFVVILHQVDWLFNCWHLRSLDRCPQDVIQMTDVVVWERFCATGVCSYRVTGVDGSCAKHLTVESCTVGTLLTFIHSYL